MTFVIILDLVAINAGVGLLWSKSQKSNYDNRIVSNNQIQTSKAVDSCGEACQAYIDQRIASFSALRPTQGQPAGPSATPKVVYLQSEQSKPKPKIRTTSYVVTPGSGSTSTNFWTDLAGTEFYFNPLDYPGLVEVYFEVNMKLFNGNGMAYVRLYDVNHGVGVQGSEAQTNSQSDGLVESGKVSFWSGKNLIRVQAKSLTADTAIFTSGRLRIVTEN